MPVLAVIPARLGSTRLPHKPLQLLAGEPLIVRVVRRVSDMGLADRTVVATDAREVAKVAAEAGCEVVMTSPEHRSGTDRVAEVAARPEFQRYDIVVNVQGDEPLIEPSLIRAVVADLARYADASVATACHPIRDAGDLDNPNVVKAVLDREGYALYFSRAPVPYARDAFARGISRVPSGLPVYRHVGIYAYRAAFLRRYAWLMPSAIERFEALEQLRALAHGYRIHCTVTRAAPPPGVDTPSDLKRLLRRVK